MQQFNFVGLLFFNVTTHHYFVNALLTWDS